MASGRRRLKGDLWEVQGHRLGWNVPGPADSKEAGAAGRVRRGRREKSVGFPGAELRGGGALSRGRRSRGFGRVRLALAHSRESLEALG